MGLFFLIFGVTLTLLGVAFAAAMRFVGKAQAGLRERCRVSAEAELVDTVYRSIEFSDEIRISYHGVYTFRTKDGRHMRAENEYGYSLPEEVAGPLVTILYNPDNPAEFLLPEEQERIEKDQVLPGLWRAGIVMLILGVPLIIAGVVFWGA